MFSHRVLTCILSVTELLFSQLSWSYLFRPFNKSGVPKYPLTKCPCLRFKVLKLQLNIQCSLKANKGEFTAFLLLS